MSYYSSTHVRVSTYKNVTDIMYVHVCVAGVVTRRFLCKTPNARCTHLTAPVSVLMEITLHVHHASLYLRVSLSLSLSLHLSLSLRLSMPSVSSSRPLRLPSSLLSFQPQIVQVSVSYRIRSINTYEYL